MVVSNEGGSLKAHFDLVIAGGRVIDPDADIDAFLDVGVNEGKVAAIAEGLRAGDGVLDATGCLVTPGLVDIHDHFFHGTGAPQRNPLIDLLPTGVTCAVEAGSSGSAHFAALRDLVIAPAPLTLYAWLNIDALGLTSHGYPRATSLELARIDEAIAVIGENPETIVGVKVLAPNTEPEIADGVELVRRAVTAAAATGTRVMCHVDGGTDLLAVLEVLRRGDIVTHCFHGNEPNIIDSEGVVRAQVWAARERGVLFDFAPCGGYHMAWGVAEAAAAQGFFPDLIGSDFVHLPDGDPSYDMTDCMTIMAGLGMELPEVVRAATTAAARAVNRQSLHGSLMVGQPADITVLAVEEAATTYHSKLDGPRTMHRTLRPRAVVRHGTIAWRHLEIAGLDS